MKHLLFLILFLFPALTFASGISKQDACQYPDGIHREEMYIYWPGEYVQVDEFLKIGSKLRYFIHTFPARSSLDLYRASGNSPLTSGGFIANKGSYFVTYDCGRSKVEFSDTVRATDGLSYGKLNWIDDRYLDFSWIRSGNINSCENIPDYIYDVYLNRYVIVGKRSELPHSGKNICVARSKYQNIAPGKIQFDIEKYDMATKESWYSRYQYQFSNKKLKKIR